MLLSKLVIVGACVFQSTISLYTNLYTNNVSILENENCISSSNNEDDNVVEILENGFCQSIGLQNVIANGTQQTFSTCSETVMGVIPSVENMVSVLIISPKNGAFIPTGTDINVTINSINMDYGFFDDPQTLYYQSPQLLNDEGKIKGHNHISIQKVECNNPPSAIDPLFFKGLNQDSDNQLSVLVNGDTFNSPGTYRICTATASKSHAPVLMPVARRGSSDDCIRIEIV